MDRGNSTRSRIAAAALIATVAVVAMGASPGPTGESVWKRLGRTQADHTRDHDVIKVKGPADNFRVLKFKVTDAPLDLRRIVVTYDHKPKENLDVRQNIQQGGESRPIDLRGGKRSIRRVEFWNDTRGRGRGKADVSLFGRH